MQREVDLTPGLPVTIELEVTNDLAVIDGLSASMQVEAGLTWIARPGLLPLFPEASGRISLELTATATFPAGSYRVPIEIASSVGAESPLETLTLTVARRPAGALTVAPLIREGRRRVSYSVQVTNAGNTHLDVALSASDPNRAAPTNFTDAVLAVGPGKRAETTMAASARRHWFGGLTSHQLRLIGSAGDLELEAQAVFRQNPMIPRGARTAAVLGTIVALWAAIFAVLLTHVLGGDPLTKQAPASFYASVASSVDHAKLQSLGGTPIGLADQSNAAPAGAVPKSGIVIGVGGTMSGTVQAASTAAGVGRINVEAFQQMPTGLTAVASAATAADGTYSIHGLLPGPYKVFFEAPGYKSLWYPAAADAASSTAVTVNALEQTSQINTTIDGLPGTITGSIATGEKPSPPVTVTVQPLQGGTTPIASVKSGADGSYMIPNLPTPGQYNLSFSSPRYQVASATDELAGGEALIANTVTLSAAPGSIAGTVTAAGAPLGGVTITAQANGQTFKTATPTTGSVGRFSLVGMPTPATYLLTFSETGYGTRVIGENLGPGQVLTTLDVTLDGGAGEVSGTVLSTAGTPLGGAQVTVDGTTPPRSTESLTAGTVGAYTLSSLPTPGTYVLTFSLAGYASQTISVPIASSGAAEAVDVKLAPELGSISGTVTDGSSGGALTGVAVSATDGTNVVATTTTSQPPGGFLLSGLAPGSYSITFSIAGYGDETVLDTLTPGAASTIDLKMSAS